MRLANSLLGKLLSYIRKTSLPAEFEEAEYLRVNPDVAYAVEKGLVRSGAAHWFGSGARERRRLNTNDGHVLPPDFDENAYVSAYPDVQIAVRGGVFPSGASHWLAVGHRDGRSYRQNGSPAATRMPLDEDWDRLVAAEDDDALPEWGVKSDAAALGGFDAAAYARRNEDVVDLIGETPDFLLKHWQKQGFREGRTPYGYRPYLDRKFGPRYWAKDNSISFFGFLSANTGLGQSARNYLKALENIDVPVIVYDVVDFDGRFVIPAWETADSGGRNRIKQSKVNIFHINADMTHRFFLDDRANLLNNTYNIAIWFWELPSFPEEWASAFGAFDEIWVASEYIRRSVACLSPIPVVKIPMVVPEGNEVEALPRSFFHIPENVFVFACIFDVGSVIARKNPGAAIQAFKQAFGERQDVLLLMKCHSSHHYPESLVELRRLAGTSRNIQFLERNLDEREMQSFRNAIDCLVSPHRSEGFGLNIAEAMLAGKPVIATGFSGNMEFMSAANSYLVDFDLRELGQTLGPYPAEALWAEPKVDDLAKHILSVFNDRKTACAKGRLARHQILSDNNVGSVTNSVSHRLRELGVFSLPPLFVKMWGRGLGGRTEFHSDIGPRVSIIVPVFVVEGRVLHRCVRSVLRQTYVRWELILCSEGSLACDTARYMDWVRGADFRIKVSLAHQDQDAPTAIDRAVELSSGELVVLLDGRDALAPDALSEVAVATLAESHIDLIYSGEGEVDVSGARRGADVPGPECSSRHDLLRDPPHLLAIRRSLLLQIGGLDSCFSIAEDRARHAARKVVHVPKVLYHRQMRDPT